MIVVEDRQISAQWIETAQHEGSRLKQACQVAGIDTRTLQRLKTRDGLQCGDGRPGDTRPCASHALSAQEREQIVQIANEPRFAELPPARIVPMLADDGVYIDSESSFSRVPKAHRQSCHRGRAKTP
jgi:putative transposase